MSEDRRIRDPIHGFISLRDHECRIVDTPLFQRLRRVHQLALAKLVYPGAQHTRFDHTLGVLHVAGKLCQVLDIDEDHTKLIRLAALLHDLGHGPFSHVSETVLDRLSSAELEKKAGQKDKIHELITQRIIREHPDLADGLTKKDRELVIALLKSGYDARIHRDIISGPLDADKQDYLLRDSFYCGVDYGTFDLNRLQATLIKAKDENNVECLMVASKGVHALEQFVLAKYYLTAQVYRHRVRLITDAMLVRGLQLGVQVDKIKPLRDLFLYPSDEKKVPAYLENYLAWDDWRITVELLDPKYGKKHAGIFFRALMERQLHKQLFSVRIADLPQEVVLLLDQDFAKRRDELEKEFAEELRKHGFKLDARHVILHYYGIDSVRTQSRNAETKAARATRPILIQRPDGTPGSFEEESVLFKSIDAKLRDAFVECYAPVQWRDEEHRNQIQHHFSEFARDRLISTFSAQTHLPLKTIAK
jgi:HD superfamily phosphohydrolase